jgi:hypothetical protein
MTFKMELPRAGHRRIKRERLRNERYAESGFNPGLVRYAGGAHFLGGRSKYMPHIGAKQRSKGAAA